MSGHADDQRLGPYRLRQKLGEGGMGVVYLATGPGEELVAVKVLRQGISVDETARHRLAQEVAAMRRVAGPHVAAVLDADLTGDPPYIVTRYVPGKTLETVVAGCGPLSGPALARLADGLAAALVAIHSAGVVHRDLKPGNVMLLDDVPVIIDFGIARVTDATRLTMTGMFLGTPGYLPPEVVEGRPSGPAADVHSWGATMAYAATGRPPFGTGTFEAIFYRIVHGQPDLDTMPRPLVPLVLRALARDPARRPSAAELAAAVSGLDPAALRPEPPASTALTAAAGPAARTAPDRVLPAAAVAVGGRSAAGSAAPGGGPLTCDGRHEFADVLPPAGDGAPAAARTAAGANGATTRELAVLPGPGAAGGSAAAHDGAARRDGWARPLTLATTVAFVAASILLPVAGVAVVLALLIGLRTADLTANWLGRRRAGRGARPGDVPVAAGLVPWAVLRSLLRLVLLAPVALVCAAAVAAVAVLATGASALPRAGAFAAGALVACYWIGPGSAPSRRPISAFYGRLTRSALGAASGFVAVTALAALSIGMAASLPPGYWPAVHLGQQLQNASLGHHPLLSSLPGSVAHAARQLLTWIGRRL